LQEVEQMAINEKPASPREKPGTIIDEDTRKRIKQIIEATRGKAGVLIRVLQQVQGLVGYLPPEALRIVSDELKVPLSEIYGIVSFYSFFSMVPKGKHVVHVCLGTACYVKGGERILSAFSRDIGLEPGGITGDKNFSLETVRCLGCCGLSPVMSVGDDVYRRVKPSEVKNIIASYE
jgi:NADH:ubiquinone oxidoreductase subunit E